MEISRGPFSSLYGSQSIGGSHTKEAVSLHSPSCRN
ncbi:MAG: hypothetical protein JXL82_03660 [Candidatus Omnitrophica bacterium]|nr:hypothetical protein [Candidatus Omnitrophota bacterium]